MYKKGIGTTPYQDAWSLFDQVIFSGAWLNKEQQGIPLLQISHLQPRIHGSENRQMAWLQQKDLGWHHLQLRLQ